MNAQRRAELIAVYRDGLFEDTLPFWLPRCVDEEHGGFMIARDRDGSVLDTDKGMWQQCRFTWLLATMYNTVEPREEWLAAARHGLEFIERHGFDASDGEGRMWFHVTREGAPIRKRRYFFHGDVWRDCLCGVREGDGRCAHGGAGADDLCAGQGGVCQ